MFNSRKLKKDDYRDEDGIEARFHNLRVDLENYKLDPNFKNAILDIEFQLSELEKDLYSDVRWNASACW